jgi:hypothetical protein
MIELSLVTSLQNYTPTGASVERSALVSKHFFKSEDLKKCLELAIFDFKLSSLKPVME